VPRLSVLDQSPVSAGSTPADALANSVSLARHVDALGYDRLWVSEHHAMATLASSAPEILLARMGGETTRIRLGSGGIMLPHYAPLKVAEVFSTLAAFYPGRIDLGLGRAPGGGPIESAALRRVRTGSQPDDFPEQLSELLAFLHGGFPASHPFSRIQLAPQPPEAPQVWLLGSSLWSAMAAADYGLPYAFAHFFSGESTREAVELYKHRFQPGETASGSILKPHTMAAVGVICASTQAEADYLLQSVRLLQLRIRQNDRRPIAAPDEAAGELLQFGPQAPDRGEFPRVFAGPPEVVRERLLDMAARLQLDELMINTITWDHEARLRSYTLLAQAFALDE
jgi:luciferase family oxidoreductase group 1